MPYITLAVTQGVINQVNTGHTYQRQLAIQGSSAGLNAQIEAANKYNQVVVSILNGINLNVGDTGAIWASHQANGVQADDFNDLYSLLSRRPDVPVTFKW